MLFLLENDLPTPSKTPTFGISYVVTPVAFVVSTAPGTSNLDASTDTPTLFVSSIYRSYPAPNLAIVGR